MALVKCPECKANISRKAQACPQCGHPVGKRKEDPAVTAIAVFIVLGVVLFAGYSCITSSRRSREQAHRQAQDRMARNEAALNQRMRTMLDTEEVAWFVVRNRDVWLGFSEWPADGQAVTNGAAHHGSGCIEDPCTVWAVRADQRDQCPPGPVRCYAWAIAKDGIVTETSAKR